MNDSGTEWQAFHERRKVSGRMPRWPNEVMLRVLFGNDYLANPVKLPEGGVVLDVGCGFGQNLLPFVEKGLDCVGVEINAPIVEVARELAEERGLPMRFEVGSNTALPFPGATFDLVLSVDTLHYEPNRDGANAALREFARVLKPAGALYLSTVGPLHDVFVRAKKFPDGHFEVQNYDFRDGTAMYGFGTEDALAQELARSFSIVETGRVTSQLMRSKIDQLLAVAQKTR